MEVNLIRENEDGSADYTFNMTDEECSALLRFAIIEALKRGIEEGKKLTPPQDDSQPALFEGEDNV